jgi:hypothetical protein
MRSEGVDRRMLKTLEGGAFDESDAQDAFQDTFGGKP